MLDALAGAPEAGIIALTQQGVASGDDQTEKSSQPEVKGQTRPEGRFGWSRGTHHAHVAGLQRGDNARLLHALQHGLVKVAVRIDFFLQDVVTNFLH